MKKAIFIFIAIVIIITTTSFLLTETKTKNAPNNEIISAGTSQTLDFSFFEIEDVKQGAYFSLFLTKSKELYYIGDILSTNNYAQLRSVHYTKIELPNGEVPKAITASVRTAYVLTESGIIYGMGRNTDGELGLPITLDENNQDMRYEIVKVSSNTNFTNIGVSAIYGGRKKLVIVKNNILYAVGNNLNGILAVGSVENKISTPTKIVDGSGFTNDGKENIIHIATNGHHTVISLDKNKDGIAETLYGWGNNRHTQILSNIDAPRDVTEPMFILDASTFSNGTDTLENTNFGIKSLSIGDFHTVFHTNNEYVYTMSSRSNDYTCINEVGMNEGVITDLGVGLPRLYRVLLGSTALKAKIANAGLYMTTILGEDNVVYSCTTNNSTSFGQAGVGFEYHLPSSPGIQAIYDNVDFVNGTSEVTKIISGTYGAMLLINGEYYGWGNNNHNLFGLNEFDIDAGDNIQTIITKVFHKRAFKITGTALEHDFTKGIIYTGDITLTEASNKTSEILLYEGGSNPISKKDEYENSNQLTISVNNNEEKKFTIEVIDTTTGNISKKFEFIIDKKPPSVEITDLESKCNFIGDIYYCSKDVDINISDLSTFISLKKDDVDFGDIVQTSTSDSISVSGEHDVLTYVVKDRAGLITILKIVLDNQAPKQIILSK